jgi:hypothetical protein
MSVTPSSTIVGVFRDQAAADQAVNALHNAGFGQEEIQYMVPGTSGSFFEGLKNFLTGTNEGGGNLVDDLTGMGLSDTDARYYANEYNNGNPILIVRAAGRETEAMSVLHQYGAYNTQAKPAYSGEAAGDMQQPTASTQQDSSMADMQPSGEDTQQSGYGAPGQYDNVQDLETQPQAQTDEEPTTPMPSAAPQEYGVYQDALASETASETDTYEQSVEATPDMDETTFTYGQTSMVVPETGTGDQAAQAGTTTPEQTDELQQLQAQLQTLQQQLQDAKARLAEAKEQENQLKTAREREQQIQSARQQLQDVQAELQATLAEHQEIQSRIAQYQ